MTANIPRLISISGSVHSGKTTVSRLIAAKMPNALYLDGDMITAAMGENYPVEASIDDLLPDVHEQIIKIIAASLKRGLDIIVDYPFDDKDRNEIVACLAGIDFQVKWFLLRPDISKVLSGSASRPELNEWEVDRIKYHYQSTLMETLLAKVIDSTNQTPDETLREIEEDL